MWVLPILAVIFYSFFFFLIDCRLKEESLAALELEYEIQRKITSAALRLATDSSLSKAVRRQRKMLYQQSLQQLKVRT